MKNFWAVGVMLKYGEVPIRFAFTLARGTQFWLCEPFILGNDRGPTVSIF